VVVERAIEDLRVISFDSNVIAQGSWIAAAAPQ